MRNKILHEVKEKLLYRNVFCSFDTIFKIYNCIYCLPFLPFKMCVDATLHLEKLICLHIVSGSRKEKKKNAYVLGLYTLKSFCIFDATNDVFVFIRWLQLLLLLVTFAWCVICHCRKISPPDNFMSWKLSVFMYFVIVDKSFTKRKIIKSCIAV